MERGRAELWTWPAAAAVAAALTVPLLTHIEAPAGSVLARIVWPGDVAAAASLMQTVATAAMSIVSLTFSLTVVALQLASQQFSPRLLRDFTRDRVTKAVLAVLVATFVFAVLVLRSLREEDDVPVLAVGVTILLAFGSLAAVLGFITHITRKLRVDTMMLTVHGEARAAIRAFYPAYGSGAARSPGAAEQIDGAWTLLPARSSGFVRSVSVDDLVSAAVEHDCLVRVVARPGDHVVQGTLLAAVRLGAGHDAPEDLSRRVVGAVALGYERTVEQDAAFGFRQLVDIAVRALSPGVNDPVTAMHCLGHLTDLLVELTGRRLGPTLHEDDEGRGRAVVEDRDLRYYLDLACGQVRRYGRQEPTVLVGLLRMLRDVGLATRDDEQRAEVLHQVGLVLDVVPDAYLPVEREQLGQVAEQVRAAVRQDPLAAFLDRSGETRSV
ncbi:DUF2254 domain-containing protein [Sanguibacter suaedae]|uniref:DUF2254 domain-containing protein n=1 Tax=Sanguibacter suaedae TaxID=2795737 RepID=A0A934IAR9_9MICO|nr:DUF2254 domain-containing protein [Sanguibacter suaedae]MBI9115295.1 DUF2254 domain-containing protein [Sanguibacter suaedae]